MITYFVSGPALLSGDILTVTGRRVTSGAIQRQATGTRGTITWNGRGAAPLPAGPYLLRLRAVADDGQQVEAVRTIIIR